MRTLFGSLLVLVAGTAGFSKMDLYDSDERSMRSSLAECRSVLREARELAATGASNVLVRFFNSNDAGVMEGFADSKKVFVRKLSPGVFFADEMVGSCAKMYPDQIQVTGYGYLTATPEIVLRVKESPVVGRVAWNPLTGRIGVRVIRIEP